MGDQQPDSSACRVLTGSAALFGIVVVMAAGALMGTLAVVGGWEADSVLNNDHVRFARVTRTALAFPTATLATLFLACRFFGGGLRDAPAHGNER